MDKKKTALGLPVFGAVVVAGRVALAIIKGARTQKPPLSSTAQQIAQNECAKSAK
jgi:hypothetical protein